MNCLMEEFYETSYHKPLALNNLVLWWDPQSSLEHHSGLLSHICLSWDWWVGYISLLMALSQSARVCLRYTFWVMLSSRPIWGCL
jgi:hypothetical protein